MDAEPALFTCDWCHKEFVPTPDNFTETGWSVFEEQDEADTWKGPQEPTGGMNLEDIPDHYLSEMREALQFDDAKLVELLKEGQIQDGFGCICHECLDAGLTEDELP